MFGPKLFQYAARKTQERFRDQFEQYSGKNQGAYTKDKRTVHKEATPKSNSSKKVGEYIDFEEIE